MDVFVTCTIASFLTHAGANENLGLVFSLYRGQIKLADFGLARLYNSEER